MRQRPRPRHPIDPLGAVFRARGNGYGCVVRNAAGKALTVNAHWFPDAVRAAGIKDFRWHDCRHTYASRLRQTGTPLGNIAELLGHRALAMTKRYAHQSISKSTRSRFSDFE
jgi:integrase